jgi:hypothetical protein
MNRILASLAGLALSACVQSPVPLESGAPVADPALMGLWKSDLRGDPMIVTIRQEKDGSLIADVLAYSAPGPTAATERYEIVLARFGDQRYLSFRNPDISPGYFLARYEFVNEHRFCVFATASEALANDLEHKRIPGQVKPDRHASNVELTANGGQLRGYFRQHGAQAFNDVDESALVFQRASSAELPPRPGPVNDPDAEVITPCRP